MPVACRLLFVLLTLVTGGCAVMASDLPGWADYSEPGTGPARPPIALAHDIRGTGSPVLLIHGFGASSYSWRYVVDTLAQEHQVITLDLKGAGSSPKPRDGHYSVYEQARLVRDFILEQGFSDLQIVGHSYGGAVALATSLYLSGSHPGLQKSLVLIDSMAYPQKLPYFINVLATPVLGPLAIHLTPNAMQVRQLLRLVYHDDTLVPEAAVQHYAAMLDLPGSKYALLQTARQVLPPDLAAFSRQYASLQLPVLIVWSRDDAIIPLEIGERLHAALPRSRLLLLEDVGHAPQEEAPPMLVPALRAFLAMPQAPAVACASSGRRPCGVMLPEQGALP